MYAVDGYMEEIVSPPHTGVVKGDLGEICLDWMGVGEYSGGPLTSLVFCYGGLIDSLPEALIG